LRLGAPGSIDHGPIRPKVRRSHILRSPCMRAAVTPHLQRPGASHREQSAAPQPRARPHHTSRSSNTSRRPCASTSPLQRRPLRSQHAGPSICEGCRSQVTPVSLQPVPTVIVTVGPYVVALGCGYARRVSAEGDAVMLARTFVATWRPRRLGAEWAAHGLRVDAHPRAHGSSPRFARSPTHEARYRRARAP
jgi:hypothetical protein